MNVLVTGSAGFVGRNLCASLKNIKNGFDRTRANLQIDEILEYDKENTAEELCEYCKKADFVFHFAGINRPVDQKEFMEGNRNFTYDVLSMLKENRNKCPVMLASSVQASLTGRYDGEYGRSKKAGEEVFFIYGKENGIPVYVYRFPNLFGKWCRPNYNSAVATFCNNIANDLPITVNDRDVELELLYIDDLISAMLDLLEGKVEKCNYEGVVLKPCDDGKYCYASGTHKVTLGHIVDTLEKFKTQPATLIIPEIPKNSFEKKLLSTYLSYLPKDKISSVLKMNVDDRGSFTEVLKTEKCGQVSVNISKPGITKGQHWHHSKWEIFLVVAGHGLIRERKIGSDEIVEFEVSGDKLEAVTMLPGYTHNIINLSETENLVTLMWANEEFDQQKPDTFFEKV